jgi:hypothetical protein
MFYYLVHWSDNESDKLKKMHGINKSKMFNNLLFKQEVVAATVNSIFSSLSHFSDRPL